VECREAQNWLLQAEDPRADRAPNEELADHLRRCADCTLLGQDVLQLEAAWRSLPLPESASTARASFLQTLPAPVAARPTRGKPSRNALPTRDSVWRRLARPRWLAAAVVLLSLGVAGWMLLTPNAAQASADLVDRLVEWNLELAEAATPDERNRIFEDWAPSLQQDLENARQLPDAEKLLARVLLANAAWLKEHDDSLAEAAKLDAMADWMLDRLRVASTRGNTRDAARYAGHYRVMQFGASAKLDKARTLGALSGERQNKAECLSQHNATRSQDLERFLAGAPEGPRKEMHKAFEMPRNSKFKPRFHSPPKR